MFILSSIFSGIYSGLEFRLVNCKSTYENPESKAFKNIKILGQICNNSPNSYMISFIFFNIWYMLRFGKATCLSFLFNFPYL